MKTLKSYRFDDSTVALIDRLRADLNYANSSDVLRRALTLLSLVNDNQKKGGSVFLRLEKSSKEIVI